jgi:DnaJ homolog subfamily C member 19
MKFVIWICIIAGLVWLMKNSFGRGSGMSSQEACRLLGLDEGADGPAIIDAHRRLIAKVHPDAGGSVELASRVNQARDILLKRLR